MENFDLRKYLAENKLLKEDTNLTMNQLEKLANIKSDEFNSSPDKLVDMVMGSVKYNLEKDGTNIENASEDEIDKLRYKWARLKGLLKVKDTFTSMYGKRGVKTNTDKDLLDKILKEDLNIDADGNLIGIANPPDTNKIKSSISKIIGWCEDMIDSYPSEDPNGRGWEILELPIKDISDVIIMHGNDVFELPESEYRNENPTMDIRIIPGDSVAILLWVGMGSLDIFEPELIGNTYEKGIISLKYNGKLIGNDFTKDINYEYGKDDYKL